MSFVVIAIGAAHAIPPILGGIFGKSKISVILGAAIGGFIALASGNPAFVAADLIGVGLGTWVGFSIAGSKAN